MDRRGLAWRSRLCCSWPPSGWRSWCPKGFIPSEDQDQLRATIEAAEGTSFDAMKRYQQQINDVMVADSNVAGFMGVIGRRAGAPPTSPG